jgi:hypothetical protein
LADFVQGDVVRDYFTIQDSSGTNLTGVTFLTGATEDPNGDSFALTVTEIGDGVYKVEFLADEVGTWYYRVDTSGLTPEQSWEETFTIGPNAISGASLGTAAAGPTLNELIQYVATKLGDFLEIEATDAGAVDGSSFQDQLRLAAIPSQGLAGASITVVSPSTSDNYLIERRVSDFAESTQVLTIVPVFPAQISTGDGAWLTNLYSRGFWRTQYVSAINFAVASAFPANLVKLEYTYASSWNQDDPYIPLATHVTHIYGVRIDDGSTDPYLVPYSNQNISSYSGWYWDFGIERLGLAGYWRYAAHGATISVLGYGRPAPLVNADDRTGIDIEWIANYAAEVLKSSKGEQRQLAQASRLENRADLLRPKIITGLEPNTLQIR